MFLAIELTWWQPGCCSRFRNVCTRCARHAIFDLHDLLNKSLCLYGVHCRHVSTLAVCIAADVY